MTKREKKKALVWLLVGFGGLLLAGTVFALAGGSSAQAHNLLPPGGSSGIQLLNPVKGYYIGRGFGSASLATGKPGAHNGSDIGAPVGAEIRNCAKGRVSIVDPDGSRFKTCGIAAIVNSTAPDGTRFRVTYCHMSVVYVEQGQEVDIGTPIGEVGYSGYTVPPGPKGAHLHLGLQVYDPDQEKWVWADPAPYIYHDR